jgi:F-type H+-transporting ATPase subunit a
MKLNPDILFYVFGFPFTNTVFSTILADVVILLIIIVLNKITLLKDIFELIVEYFEKTTLSIVNDEKMSNVILPFIMSFFLFILISNLLSQMPGFESIKIYTVLSGKNGFSLLKTSASDINFTFALSVVSIFLTHIISIKYSGIFGYLSKFFSFKNFPIFLFVGVLEILNELAKFVSFSFRLFGNVFAGLEVMKTMYSLCPIGLPVLFSFLEILVSFIQAVVFSMLTMAFMHIMTSKTH